jgi:K+-transporting ATPase KdpF subunit
MEIWMFCWWVWPSFFSSHQRGSSLPWIVSRGARMGVMYVVGGILSVALLVYLMIALLKPEKF